MGCSVMGMSAELLVCMPVDEFHPMGYVMNLFWLGTDCHKTAFTYDPEDPGPSTPMRHSHTASQEQGITLPL